MSDLEPGLILVTGATGYVGGQLVPRLVHSGQRVRVLVRNPARLAARVRESTEISTGDITDAASLKQAFAGVGTAYYLVHSLSSGGDFESEEVAAARNFACAAVDAGVRRFVYLSALGHEDLSSGRSSRHMRSRHAVGEALRASGIQVIELRSAMILGAGSLPFEMVRSLVERLPVMVTPRWVRWPTQPISAQDAIEYLALAATVRTSENVIVEIGGRDVASFQQIMAEYARQRGLRRLMINVPVISPRLSSLWLLVFTPARFQAGRRLVDSAAADTVVRDASARSLFTVEPVGLEDSIRLALETEDRRFDESPDWATITGGREWTPWGGVRRGGRIIETRTTMVDASPERVFEAAQSFGGRSGLGTMAVLWKLRGLIDRIIGGPGMVEDERTARDVKPGQRFDMWRVDQVDKGKAVVFAAIARLPGRAWLRFDVEPGDRGQTILRQTAMFDSRGLLGRIYWYALYPFHSIIFRSLLRRVSNQGT